MRPYQQSFLDEPDQFVSLPVPKDHEMVVLADNLDWDFLQAIGEIRREQVVLSTRGKTPHHRVLMGAVIVRSLRGCDLRSAEDLIANYLPARYLCRLADSTWNPDHNTIWEYEVMLGTEGLQQVNDYVLNTAAGLGFADVKGLCSDTTAQEADIPYPNEVGHMNSFMKSLRENVETLLKRSKGLEGKIVSSMKSTFSKVAQSVRKHRLFAKTKEARLEINRELFKYTEKLIGHLGDLLGKAEIKGNDIKGSGKRALNNLVDIYHSMSLMLPQIYTWIQEGRVVPQKIISLFNTELRAINRGKSGKKIEFGLKWGVNQIRGGYISVFTMVNMMAHDASYSVEAVKEHLRIFGEPPRDFGFDRGGWSQDHLEEVKSFGVTNIGVAPKGRARWLVGPRVKARLTCERSQVEGKIGTIKLYGMNKPKAKSQQGLQRTAYRAGLCFNLKRFCKDLTAMSLIEEEASV